jgi:hypothetical protein
LSRHWLPTLRRWWNSRYSVAVIPSVAPWPGGVRSQGELKTLPEQEPTGVRPYD